MNLNILHFLADDADFNRPSRPIVQRPLPRPQSVEPFFETRRIPLPDVRIRFFFR